MAYIWTIIGIIIIIVAIGSLINAVLKKSLSAIMLVIAIILFFIPGLQFISCGIIFILYLYHIIWRGE